MYEKWLFSLQCSCFPADANLHLCFFIYKESGITLRARGISEKCAGLAEEATSESRGEFRFRGLVPGCQYSIGLREGSSTDIEKLIPRDTLILMEAKDMKVASSIVAFRSVEIMDVTMTVSDEADPASEANVKVSMTDHLSYSYTVKRVIGEMITLPAVPKENGKKYTITVETFAEKYSPKRKVSTVIAADNYYKFVNVTIPKSSPSSGGQDGQQGQKASPKKMLILLPLIILGIVAYFYRDQLPYWYSLLVDKVGGGGGSAKAYGQKSEQLRSGESGGDSEGLRRRTKKRLA